MKEPQEPYPGFASEAAARAERAREFSAAAADPLPGPMAEAFAQLPAEVAGLRVRKVVHYDFVVLKLLKSPLLERLGGGGSKKKSPPFNDDQGYEMIYQFTRPVEEIEAWLAKQPPAQAAQNFRTLARREIGMKLGPMDVGLLVKGVERAMLEAFATVLKFSPKDQGTGDQVFTKPPADHPTAPAGGSTISAG